MNNKIVIIDQHFEDDNKVLTLLGVVPPELSEHPLIGIVDIFGNEAASIIIATHPTIRSHSTVQSEIQQMCESEEEVYFGEYTDEDGSDGVVIAAMIDIQGNYILVVDDENDTDIDYACGKQDIKKLLDDRALEHINVDNIMDAVQATGTGSYRGDDYIVVVFKIE
jgi:hypothetical protein